ncbi:MAG: hypothetical protein A2X34_10495 [Elusimicrobia bacterium GWC2_51_8]|nr:MAG: hypothetical protein A2X33_01000 [Elusimicrobia bacterium GWA2_51_34]OGR57584.1 MAG: hypothetical protein A2X34_10495 [Elusimicrobia bacterium GWC2_51_8]OGR87571.1 MAG: hypothetical protein A2021_09135 [Elusimicrobia bacterium GWF2_52_66]HCE97228.1 hypothetical protein [Elusimicrobiota bacterium]
MMDSNGKLKKATEGNRRQQKATECKKNPSSETFSCVPSLSVAFRCFLWPSLAFLCFFCACSAPEPGAPAPARERAVVFKTRLYALSKTSDPDLEIALPDIVAESHNYAFKKAGAPADAGFSYTLAPRGAVYPFSEMEVACVIREKYASRYGAKLCSVFFFDLGKKIKNILQKPPSTGLEEPLKDR